MKGAVIAKRNYPTYSKMMRRDLHELTTHEQEQIIKLVASGEHPVDAEIAEIVGVPTTAVTKFVESDAELVALRESAQHTIAQKLEQAAIDICLNSRVDIARVQMLKEMLPKLKPEVYGDEAAIVNKAKGIRRVALSMDDLPEVSSPAELAKLNSKSPLD